MEHRKVSRDFITMSQSHVTVTVCHMTRVTWGPWESKHIATIVKYISSREMSENSIEFSLSNSEQRDSWLNSSHQTLDTDTIICWRTTTWTIVHCRSTRWRLHYWTTKEVSGYLCHRRRKVVVCSWGHESWDRGIVIIDLIDFRCSIHELFFCFISLHISNSSVSTSLVEHVLYSADLMSAICTPHFHLMVHRYIYSRYSSVFLILYQLYHSLPSSTLNLSSSLYLSVATWVTS